MPIAQLPDIFPIPKKTDFSLKVSKLPLSPSFSLTAPKCLEPTLSVLIQEWQRAIPSVMFKTRGADVHLTLKLNASLSIPEAYRLSVRMPEIILEGKDAAGVLYAGVTLCQLFQKSVKKSTVPSIYIRDVEINDYPDVPYRACSRWLIELECSRMAYDWGDGRKGFLRRCREKIDFAMRYKINLAFFDGFTWNDGKYPGYADDMLALRHYAAARNVRLEYGGHYIGFGGRNPSPDLQAKTGYPYQKGLGDLNRRQYPNGKPYRCMGMSEDHQTRFNGACRSNEALNKLKHDELLKYTKAMEPSMLYIHPEDIRDLQQLAIDWNLRCDECRKRWPSDIPEAIDGCAGAQGYGLVHLCKAVAEAKNDDGYDGEKDCVICIVPAAYAGGDVDDHTWERLKIHYCNIARQLPKNQKILLLAREQFVNWSDNSRLRIMELAETLKKVSNCGIAVFAINGADGFVNGRLFMPTARLNGYYRGAELIFNFAGTIFQEIQEAYNSECCWNLPPLDPAMHQKLMTCRKARPDGINFCYDDVSQICYKMPREMYSKNSILGRLCRHYYGKEAGEAMQKVLLLGNCSHFVETYPLTNLSFHFWFRALLDIPNRDPNPDKNPEHLHKIWSSITTLTEQAHDIVLPVKDAPEDPFARESLDCLTRTLDFGRDVAGVVRDIFARKGKQELLQRIQAAQSKLDTLFGHDFISPDDGLQQDWPLYLKRLAAYINSPEFT